MRDHESSADVGGKFPGSLYEFSVRCRYHQERGEYHEGLQFTDALRGSSLTGDQNYWLWRASFLERLDRPNEAEQCLSEGMGRLVTTTSVDGLAAALGRLMNGRREFAGAIVVLSGAARRSGNPSAQTQLIRALRHSGSASLPVDEARAFHATSPADIGLSLELLAVELSGAHGRVPGCNADQAASVLEKCRALIEAGGSDWQRHQLAELEHEAQVKLATLGSTYEWISQRACPKLRGRIVPVVHWLSEEGSPWLARDKSAMASALRSAMRWIEGKARLHGVHDVLFSEPLELHGPPRPDGSIPVGSGDGNCYTGWAEDFAAERGCKSAVDCRRSVLSAFNGDETVLVVMINKSGRSFAVPAHWLDPQSRSIPSIAMYRNLNGWVENDAGFAHELLHLFGAHDLYEMFGFSGSKAKLAGQSMSNEIMRSTWDSLDNLSVSELTAWRVGWNQPWQPWFAEFEPDRSR